MTRIVAASDVGIPNGVAPLDSTALVPLTYIPTLTGKTLNQGTLSGTTQIQGPLSSGSSPSVGTAGQVLTSAGPGLPPSWTSVTGTGSVTSVGMTVPSFLSVANSPITSAGVLNVTLSGTALPVSSGGTGSITIPTDGQLLIGNGTGFTLGTISGGGGITVVNTAGGIALTTSNIPNAGLQYSAFTLGSTSVSLGDTKTTIAGLTLASANFTTALTLSGSSGTVGQVLTSGGPGAAPTWTTVTSGSGGTVTSVGVSVPSFLSVANSPVTSSGTIAISLSGTALPVSSGGTGATTLSGLAYGNGTTAFTAATGAQVAAVIGSIAVTNATNVNSVLTTTDADFFVALGASSSGYQGLGFSTGITVNPSTGAITNGIHGGSF